jgi:hypothetical protein
MSIKEGRFGMLARRSGLEGALRAKTQAPEEHSAD